MSPRRARVEMPHLMTQRHHRAAALWNQQFPIAARPGLARLPGIPGNGEREGCRALPARGQGLAVPWALLTDSWSTWGPPCLAAPPWCLPSEGFGGEQAAPAPGRGSAASRERARTGQREGARGLPLSVPGAQGNGRG